MAVKFLDLNDDILLKIAHLCTASEVVALERTCKPLRSLFSQSGRHLWIHLLIDLDNFHAPELPPRISIDSLSFRDLRRLVMRASDGYANWNTLTPSGPRVTRRRIIDLKNKGGLLGEVNRSGREAVKVLAGGKYLFVLWSEGYLQWWDIEENKSLWTYPQLGGFQNGRVTAFDVDYDESNGALFLVLLEREVASSDFAFIPRPEILRSFWLNPELKYAARGNQARIELQSFDAIERIVIKICGASVIVFRPSSFIILSRNLQKQVEAAHHGILYDSIDVSDDYVLFVGMIPSSSQWEFCALNARQIFTDPRMRDVIERKLPLAIGSERLRQFLLHVPLSCPLLSSHWAARGMTARLTTCKPTWRDPGAERDAQTTIYLIAKPSASHSPNGSQSSSTTFHLTVFNLITPPFLPPSLVTVRTLAPMPVPLSHPFCDEEVHSLSHAGRGVISSTNSLHKGVRYYAFSFEELLNGRIREKRGPISFGKELVAPGKVFMEKYSGSLAYVTKDQKSLVIQYYD